jgi:hypothetical protein
LRDRAGAARVLEAQLAFGYAAGRVERVLDGSESAHTALPSVELGWIAKTVARRGQAALRAGSCQDPWTEAADLIEATVRELEEARM